MVDGGLGQGPGLGSVGCTVQVSLCSRPTMLQLDLQCYG